MKRIPSSRTSSSALCSRWWSGLLGKSWRSSCISRHARVSFSFSKCSLIRLRASWLSSDMLSPMYWVIFTCTLGDTFFPFKIFSDAAFWRSSFARAFFLINFLLFIKISNFSNHFLVRIVHWIFCKCIFVFLNNFIHLKLSFIYFYAIWKLALEIIESLFFDAVVASVSSGCGVPARVAWLGIIRRGEVRPQNVPVRQDRSGRMITYSPNLITAEQPCQPCATFRTSV